MRVVCPSCDAEPALSAVAGAACASCRTPLVRVRDDTDLVGTVIDGRFEILAPLGKGGMGTVFRAKQMSIGREVALKLIDPRLDDDVTAIKRFMREARLASQLVHPNTVSVIEFGQDRDDRFYLVMELVHGKTLHELLKAGAFSTSRIIRIGTQLCDALEAAHALGIVHRDLKLENVILLEGPTDRDLVKILDFGLARSLTTDSRATATGLVTGTPRYLAPEVVLEGAAPAPDQDMYALGVLLGELALGGTLWQAPTFEALFAQKLHGELKLDAIEPALRTLVQRLLEVDPRRRPTAANMRELIGGLGTSKTTQSPIALAATLAPVRARAPISDPTSELRESAMLDVHELEPLPLPSAAFAPPAPAAPKLELEIETGWQREKAAKIEAAAHPPKRSIQIWGILAALVAIAIVVTVVVIIGTRSGPPARPAPIPVPSQLPATANTVTIEVRANPSASISFDGHEVGRTPLTMHVPKTTAELTIEAIVAGRPQIRQIVPDHDQAVDFK